MEEKIKEYREKFVEHMLSFSIDKETAESEVDAYIKMMDDDDLDYENPEWDANQCLSYWDWDW